MNETLTSVGQNQSASPACIRDIFSQGNGTGQFREYCKVYPGVTFARNSGRITPDKGNQKTSGTKRPIVTFSDKSRRNMMVKLAMIEEPLQFWQNFTFADDVMEGKSIGQRAIYTSNCLKYFKQELERKGFKVDGVWKREWKRRRSGTLEGQFVPHFHMVFAIPGYTRKEYLRAAGLFAQIWVKVTGTKNEDKALQVALHRNSSRFIESRKQMQKYMSKYMVKNDKCQMLITAESIGRNWGMLGAPKFGEGQVIDVTEREMILFKRCLRKHAKHAKGLFREMLLRKHTKFFILIESKTVIRYFEFLKLQAMAEVPF